MYKYYKNMTGVLICYIAVRSYCIQASQPQDYLELSEPAVVTQKFENGIYIPERFWASTHNAEEQPLIAGPACPCIIVFAAKPQSTVVFGAHLYHLNSIKSLVHSINSFYQLPSYGEKPQLSFSLFTRTHSEIHKEFVFKEGSHLECFQALLCALDSAYSIINCSYYFDDSLGLTLFEDRWVACTGVDSMQKLKVQRFHPIYSRTFVSREHIDNYLFLIYKEKFSIHQMLNILPGNMWEAYDQEMINLDSKDTIATINNFQLSPENSVYELLQYRMIAKKDLREGRNTTLRAIAEQKMMNVDY